MLEMVDDRALGACARAGGGSCVHWRPSVRAPPPRSPSRGRQRGPRRPRPCGRGPMAPRQDVPNRCRADPGLGPGATTGSTEPSDASRSNTSSALGGAPPPGLGGGVQLVSEMESSSDTVSVGRRASSCFRLERPSRPRLLAVSASSGCPASGSPARSDVRADGLGTRGPGGRHVRRPVGRVLAARG